MKTTEQIFTSNTELRTLLEKESPGCTRMCVKGETHETMQAEETALLAIQAALESRSAVNARGASVAANHLPSASLPPSKQRVAAGGAKALHIQSEITRFEAMLPGATGTTKAAFESKLAGLRLELSRLATEE